jgi:vacuolar protein sorting-associated protein 72
MALADDQPSLSGAETSEDEEMVESLIAGREKRTTAGRIMPTLLDAEADDELALLFAEDEDDDEFDVVDGGAEGEDAEDMRLDSSSEDEDDQGPNAAEDDDEGEREIEKQAKAERLAKKRKIEESLSLPALRKKVKIDPTPVSTTSSSPPRPKKKSERISWLPTPDTGPTRASSRRQTMQNKELTHARLKDSEERRIKLIATMEEAAKKKEKSKPKVMTQAERLAEAAKIERLNSKSLNRWEEMEKRKAEERRAKLEALQNRRLEGPVMSWWSGIAKWVNGKLTRVGNVEVKPKPEKEEPERKKRGRDVTIDSSKGENKNENIGNDGAEKRPITGDGHEMTSAERPPVGPSTDKGEPPVGERPPQDASTNGGENVPKPSGEAPAIETQDGNETPSQRSAGFLDGIHLYASLPESSVNSDKPDSERLTVPLEKAPTSASVAEPATSTTGPTSAPEDTSSKPEESTLSKEEKARQELKPTHSDLSNGEAEKPETVPQTSDAAASKDQNPETESAAPESEAQLPKSTETAAETPSAKPDLPTSEAPSSGPSPAAATALPVPEPMQVDEPSTIDNADQQPVPNPVSQTEPSLPPAPEIVEQTGRNLLILENFDDKTAQSREYSIYFNSKKPPRLTSELSSFAPVDSSYDHYYYISMG